MAAEKQDKMKKIIKILHEQTQTLTEQLTEQTKETTIWKHKYALLKQDFGNTKQNYEAEL